MRALAAVALVGALVSAMMSCHANPNVQGSKVGTVGSPTDVPTCAQICTRLAALCGYAPVDCTDEDAAGFCDTQITDDSERVCIGYGADDGDGGFIMTTSCELAWDCVANAPATYGGTDDDAATDDEAGDDDAGDQGGDEAGDDAGPDA